MKVGFSGEKELFELISGFTITEQFNETLDNANIIIRSNHRLNIKPYDEVCFENGHCMLVDNFVETQESLITEQFIYKITLMSLTKLLEKIQLPNKIITHSLVSGQKNIYEYINEYLELYSPKIRVLASDGVHWETKQMFYNALSFTKYSVPCRDLGFSKPTLRQALTTLMLQIGCIPVLKKNQTTNQIELHDIDFRAKGNDITQLDNYCNYITRSNASDSYVNTLKVVAENILDEGLVTNELLGFRDTNNVFLKQKENLTLQTRFPIYKVNKFILNLFITTRLILIDMPSKQYTALNGYIDDEITYPEDGWSDTTRNWVGFYIAGVSSTDKTITIYKNSVLESTGLATRTTAYRLKLTNVVINDLAYENSVLRVIKSTKHEDIDIPADGIGVIIDHEKEEYSENTATSIVADLYWEYGEYSGTLKQFATNQEIILNPNVTGQEGLNYLYSTDITPLCIEYSKRQLLDTNFLEMEGAENLEELAQYIYGTVGYKIGTNVIEGFSQTYDKAIGWWNASYTYIENIFNVVIKQDPIGISKYEYLQNNVLGGLPYDLIGYELTTIDNVNYTRKPFTFQPYGIAEKLFTNMFFDIEYQALNKANVSVVKDNIEVNIPIEQYDSSDNAITNANDLVAVEQQKVDRLGNDVITINQRIPLSANETGYELNDRILGEYIIFKKEMQYNPYDIQIVYTASKDYVLQNFFTAIQTKYRAYEYIDYGEAVLRQENTKISVLVDNFAIYNANTKMSYIDNWKLISALWNTEDYADYKLKYVIKADNHLGYRSDLSIMTTLNNILLTSVEFDSVSHGIYISSPTLDGALGGLPQQWYINTPEFLEQHTTYYTREFKMFGSYYGTLAEIKEKITLAGSQPQTELTTGILNSPNINRTYYLDQQERLNETIQFEYFTTNKGIKWTNLLQELCLLVNDKKYTKVVYFDNDINVSDQAHTIDTYYENIEDYVSYNAENNNIRILWSSIPSQYSVIKFGILENGKVRDIMSIDNTNTFVYVSLLDIKSLKVGSYRNGCLVFDEYEIAKNNVNKIVNRL